MMEGLTVLYTRNPGGGLGEEGQGAVQPLAFYARSTPQGEEGLTLLSVRSVPQAQAREGEAEGVGPFWARSKEGESGLFAVPASALVQGEDKEAPKRLDVQVVGGRGGSGGGEDAGLQVYTPASGSSQTGTVGGGREDRSGIPGKPGDLQIVWRRAQEQVRGGVVPPGVQTASSPGSGIGSQGSFQLPFGSEKETSPNSPPPAAP